MRSLLTQSDQCDGQTIIGLLRHGKTLWNEEGRIQGRQDSPLSRSGREQAHEWGDFLRGCHIDQIVASDMGRARETLAILQAYCHSLPVTWEPQLREQSWGEWEGKTFQELQADELNAQVRAGWDFRPPGGESRREVLKRAMAVMQKIVEQFPGQRVLVVCHEGVIKSLIYHLSGRAFLPEEKKLLQKRQLHLLCGTEHTLMVASLNILPPIHKTKP